MHQIKDSVAMDNGQAVGTHLFQRGAKFLEIEDFAVIQVGKLISWCHYFKYRNQSLVASAILSDVQTGASRQ